MTPEQFVFWLKGALDTTHCHDGYDLMLEVAEIIEKVKTNENNHS